MTTAEGVHASSSRPNSALAAALAGSRIVPFDALRAYPLNAASDAHALKAELSAMQALLRAESPPEVAAIVATLVHDLGGTLAPTRDTNAAAAFPNDVAIDLGEPHLPLADPGSLEALRLAEVLPRFMEAARLVLSRMHGPLRRYEEGARDQATGLMTRRAWMRRLAAAAPGDGVCLIELQGEEALSNSEGGDRDVVLRAVAALMLRTFRLDDSCGRYSAGELACLTVGFHGAGLRDRCEQLQRAWRVDSLAFAPDARLRIEVADVGPRGGAAALRVAELALHGGGQPGRNAAEFASPAAYAQAWRA